MQNEPTPFKERLNLFGEMMTRQDFRTAVERLTTLLRRAVEQMHEQIGQRLAELKDGYTPVKGKDYFDGYTPVKGKDYFDGRTPVKGKDYFDGETPVVDHDAIVAKAVEITVPQALDALEKNLPMLAGAIRNALELLPVGERPGPGVIEGLDEYMIGLIKKHGYNDMGGAAVGIMQAGALKVQTAQTLDFRGSGAPTVTHDEQGVTRLTFPAAGGETILTATETPDGSNAVFTFAAAASKPTYVYADNTRLRATTKSGTVNWTWDNTLKQATLSVAPQDEIYAVV